MTLSLTAVDTPITAFSQRLRSAYGAARQVSHVFQELQM